MEMKELMTLCHLNVRKEGPEEEKEVAIDIKLKGDVSSVVIEQLFTLPGEEHKSLEKVFWLDDEAACRRFETLGELKIERRFEAVSVTIQGLHLQACTVKKFSAYILDHGKAELTMSVSCPRPPSNAVGVLSEVLQEEVSVQAISEQPDLFDEEAA